MAGGVVPGGGPLPALRADPPRNKPPPSPAKPADALEQVAGVPVGGSHEAHGDARDRAAPHRRAERAGDHDTVLNPPFRHVVVAVVGQALDLVGGQAGVEGQHDDDGVPARQARARQAGDHVAQAAHLTRACVCVWGVAAGGRAGGQQRETGGEAE